MSASKAAYDDVNSHSLALVGLYSVIITFITMVGVQVLYFAMVQRHEERKVLNTDYTAATEVLESQRQSLTGYRKEVREDGENKREYQLIPIDKAIEAVVKEKRAGAHSEEGHDQT